MTSHIKRNSGVFHTKTISMQTKKSPKNNRLILKSGDNTAHIRQRFNQPWFNSSDWTGTKSPSTTLNDTTDPSTMYSAATKSRRNGNFSGQYIWNNTELFDPLLLWFIAPATINDISLTIKRFSLGGKPPITSYRERNSTAGNLSTVGATKKLIHPKDKPSQQSSNVTTSNPSSTNSILLLLCPKKNPLEQVLKKIEHKLHNWQLQKCYGWSKWRKHQ